MREILFRGKQIDNDEWIEGSLVHRTQFYGETDDCYFILYDGEFHCDYYGSAEVDFKTIGQYTGLNDKNGKKIFEGDIVNEYDMPEKISNTGIVKWSNMFMGWHISQARSMYCHEYMSYEVIGNIHDNPELLEGDNE